MLKKLGIPILALAGALSLAPKPANAKVHVGFYIGPPPVYGYTYPYDPYYGYSPYPYGFSYAPYGYYWHGHAHHGHGHSRR